jgi:hypothetical protein
MSGRPVCLYDANVLYSAQLRGFLVRLALGEVVQAHWTEQIHVGAEEKGEVAAKRRGDPALTWLPYSPWRSSRRPLTAAMHLSRFKPV